MSAAPKTISLTKISLEDTMTSKRIDDKVSRTIELGPRARAYPSLLHETLGMTAQEVEADIRASGKTPRQVLGEFEAMILTIKTKQRNRIVTTFDNLIQDLRAKHLESASESDDASPIDDGLESLRFYEESVAAGIPMGDSGDVPYRDARRSDFFGHHDWKSMFVAKVSGWSMREDHITDGDVVLVDANARPKDGDIVLAYIAGEGQVVKRFRVLGSDRIMLESANPDFKPIMIDDPASVMVRGVVKGRAGRI